MSKSTPQTDIAELFRRDPLKLSDQDIDQIIEQFRSSRHQFNKGNMKAGSTKPLTEKQKTAKEMSEKVNLDIKDLLT